MVRLDDQIGVGVPDTVDGVTDILDQLVSCLFTLNQEGVLTADLILQFSDQAEEMRLILDGEVDEEGFPINNHADLREELSDLINDVISEAEMNNVTTVQLESILDIAVDALTAASEVEIPGGNTGDGDGGADPVDPDESEADRLLVGTADNNRLEGGAGADQITGGAGRDILRGSRGGDDLRGNGGSDRLFGGSGDDMLAGGKGNDLLRGGRGDDTLIGGRGDDVLVGGAGANVFIFRGPFGDDTIRDFTPGVDTLDLTALGGSTEDITIAVADDTTVITVGENSITLLGAFDPGDINLVL